MYTVYIIVNFFLPRVNNISGQTLQATIQPMEYPLGISHLLAGWHSVGHNQESHLLCPLANRFQKSHGVECSWFFPSTAFSPCSPSPWFFGLTLVQFNGCICYLKLYQKKKTLKKASYEANMSPVRETGQPSE